MKKGITITVIFLINLTIFTSRAENDTLSLISSWTLIKDYSLKKKTRIDTLLHAFQNFNPIFRNSISNTYLGNIGSSAISNIHTDRKIKNNFLLINPYNTYMSTFSNTKFFNTRKPFTRLTYTNGGEENIREETLEAFHTQNISKYFNAGLKYNLISANGMYKFQKIVNNAFKIFTSYEKPRYNLYANFNLNKIKADENGGIINDSLVTDSTFENSTDIPTVFGGSQQGIMHDPDVLTTIKNINLLIVQELNIIPSGPGDTLMPEKEKKFIPSIAHILEYDRSIRIHRDKLPEAGLEAGLYSTTHYNPEFTLDSVYYKVLSNTLRFKLNNINKKREIIMNLDLKHEIEKCSFYTPSDNQINFAGDTSALYRFTGQTYNPDTLKRSRIMSNTSATYNVSYSKGNLFKTNIWASYFFHGYKAGSHSLNAEFTAFPGNESGKSFITLFLSYQNEVPDYLLQNYYSNYFIWENDFKSVKSIDIDLKYINPLKKIETGVNYSLLNDYIYFNEYAIPSQYEKNLSVVTLHLDKFLEFWKFRTLNKLAFQFVSKPDYISLPEFAVYNSTYIEHEFFFRWTEGRLRVMLGFDLFYNTKYYANAYNPALGMFHQQNEKKLGNYPYLDVFLNIKLKRTRFFLKYEHVNYGLIHKNYFSALHYPRNEGMFKAGISWTFYD
jgi:hypothetical protein